MTESLIPDYDQAVESVVNGMPEGFVARSVDDQLVPDEDLIEVADYPTSDSKDSDLAPDPAAIMESIGDAAVTDITKDAPTTPAEADEDDGELKGAALDEALEERGLAKTGTADEKRARVAEYDAENA